MGVNKLEKRILAYLSVVVPVRKNIGSIHEKIGVEYSYLCRTLRIMFKKELLTRHEKNKARNKVIYDITPKGREVLTDETR